MTIAWEVALWLVVLWLGGLLFQIADVGTAWFDLRNARTSTGQLARRRTHELFWVAPTAALLALALAFGIDLAAILVFDRDVLLVVGILLALAVIVLVVSVTVVATVTLLTRDIQSYALLRFTIGDAQTRKLTKADVDAWRSELQAIDEREAVRHEKIARLLRFIPIVLAVLALAAVWVAIISDFGGPDGWGSLIVGFATALIPAASIFLAIRSARISLRARASWALVNGKQRAELVKTLDELERRTSRGVAGLSDRVNRALQILREQQL
ncbi:MAG TPA: hypothetical protein VFT01_04180 [Homoserinimonas sp.]|nr:hypothetical protein [Homoserinimonas sp.]